ncbi:MAG: PilZ domain-containing protein [Planctomycetales bacterium]|nr:PilZ domain-containing protein [Planctomycetales bacterium]
MTDRTTVDEKEVSDSGTPASGENRNLYLPVDEQRQATRFPYAEGTKVAAVWREPGDELLVDVHDESLGGLGIIVDSTLGLEVGSCLNVIFAGEYMDGEVRHIEQIGDRYLVGLRCQKVIDKKL